jgi:hypothetical protein
VPESDKPIDNGGEAKFPPPNAREERRRRAAEMRRRYIDLIQQTKEVGDEANRVLEEMRNLRKPNA